MSIYRPGPIAPVPARPAAARPRPFDETLTRQIFDFLEDGIEPTHATLERIGVPLAVLRDYWPGSYDEATGRRRRMLEAASRVRVLPEAEVHARIAALGRSRSLRREAYRRGVRRRALLALALVALGMAAPLFEAVFGWPWQ